MIAIVLYLSGGLGEVYEFVGAQNHFSAMYRRSRAQNTVGRCPRLLLAASVQYRSLWSIKSNIYPLGSLLTLDPADSRPHRKPISSGGRRYENRQVPASLVSLNWSGKQ